MSVRHLSDTPASSPCVLCEQDRQGRAFLWSERHCILTQLFQLYASPSLLWDAQDESIRSNRVMGTLRENYELDVRENFPSETAGLIWKPLDQFAIDIRKTSGTTEGDHVSAFLTDGLSGQSSPSAMHWIMQPDAARQIPAEAEILIVLRYRKIPHGIFAMPCGMGKRAWGM